MNEYHAPLNEMRFILYEVFNVSKKWQKWHETKEIIDQTIANAILEEASKLSTKTLSPLYQSSDKEGCQLNNKIISTPSGFKEAYQTYTQGGWVGLTGNSTYNGMNMPYTISTLFEEICCSANLSFMLYPSLSSGAAFTIDSHATDTLKQQYLPELYSGKWSGTMCLTEADAGSDLSLIQTKAIQKNNENYLITGTKIFITGGEHDLCENIIHLVLAKLPNAPKNSQGISLFLVPKFIPKKNQLIPNQLHCSALENKMGIKGATTCVINFDEATGFLIGEPHKGLACMFTMMNKERLFVGIQGLASAERSYQNAASYAKSRLQGRIHQTTNKQKADPIIVHGDIRRTLLTMKALNEGGRAFSIYVAHLLDAEKYNPEKQKIETKELIALLTPVSKAFLTDLGLACCIDGQQIFGGHGYIKEWEQEQLVRDVRITQIYEGTNGIQALDLLGRKILSDSGNRFSLFTKQIHQFSQQYPNSDFNEPLNHVLTLLENTTQSLIENTKDNPNLISTACLDYLHGFGYVAYAWMWALMAETAKVSLKNKPNNSDFYETKIHTANFFYKRLLPRAYACFHTALRGEKEIYAINNEQF